MSCVRAHFRHHFLVANMVQFVLTMIVRNESAIIERCLNAIADIVHGVAIVDTGSEDDTPDRIRAWCKRHHTPCVIDIEPFINFGESRSQSLELARRAVRSWEWDVEDTFSLLVDADMCVHWTGDADELHTTMDHILAPTHVDGATLTQINQRIRYCNLRFARTSREWRCIGATHEYYGMDESKQHREHTVVTIPRDTMWIDDKGDGGCKADKFVRDERLLRDELESQPDNPRTHFYLAQTLSALEKHEEAIQLYRKRAAMGGFHEEAFMALVRGAEICITHSSPNTTRRDEGVGMLLRAMEMRPHRAEPSFLLASEYHKGGEHLLCTIFAIESLRCNAGNDVLFVDHEAENKIEAIRFLGISAFYAGRMGIFRRACDVVACAPDVTYPVRENAHRNMRFGVGRADDLFGIEHTMCCNTRMEEMGLSDDDWDMLKGYRSCQASVDHHVEEDGRVRVLVRFVNYRLHVDDNGVLTWTIAPPPYGDGTTIRTRMGLGWLNLKTLRIEELTLVRQSLRFLPWQTTHSDGTDSDSGHVPGPCIRGLEDARIVHQLRGRLGCGDKREGAFLVIGTGCVNPDTGAVHLAKATLHAGTDGHVQVDEGEPIPQPFDPHRTEKNWMPCCSPDGSRILFYDANHASATNLGRSGWTTPSTFELGPKQPPHDLQFRHRGGAACWVDGIGILCVIHEVTVYGAGHTRLYVHRFVLIDPFTMVVQKRTLPFRFNANHPVEFAMGLLVSNGTVFVTFGVADAETWTFSTPLYAVLDNMYSIDLLGHEKRAAFVLGE